MKYTGILFDLFGTLVPPFRKSEHVEVMRECAAELGMSFDDCHRYWLESFHQRMRGKFQSVADQFDHILRQAKVDASPDTVIKAGKIFERFAIEGLKPVHGALDTLDWVRGAGLRVGLVSNCAWEPKLWNDTAFAGKFEYCAFSSELGYAKPEPEIYRAALTALDLDPRTTLYVGDGSDQELTGALRCDIVPVLVKIDLSNAYDTHRADVENWNGPTIHSLSELRQMV